MRQTGTYYGEERVSGRLAILTIRAHLCGFFEQKSECVNAGNRVDPDSGHLLCCGCSRITVSSGLMVCDICDIEYINKAKRQDKHYETNCPKCVEEYGLEDGI
jgi:hypothetical protein